jgi:hypothetical protein
MQGSRSIPTTIAFIDESGTPDIPMLAKKRGSVRPVFSVAMCLMDIEYWRTLDEIYKQVREAFYVPTGDELKWANLVRKTGPAQHMDDAMVREFIQTLVRSIDRARFRGVIVSIWKDAAYQSKGYIRDAQDVYNIAIRFAIQRLQNDLDEMYGAGADCPTMLIADSRRGTDNRLRRFVDDLISNGDLWVDLRRSIIEGIMFQVSNYSVGLQIADMIAGAAFQMDVRGNTIWYRIWEPLLRRSPEGRVQGYGYIQWRG